MKFKSVERIALIALLPAFALAVRAGLTGLAEAYIVGVVHPGIGVQASGGFAHVPHFFALVLLEADGLSTVAHRVCRDAVRLVAGTDGRIVAVTAKLKADGVAVNGVQGVGYPPVTPLPLHPAVSARSMQLPWTQ